MAEGGCASEHTVGSMRCKSRHISDVTMDLPLRAYLSVLAIATTLPSTILAEPIALTAPEIETLLTGQTISGDWSGTSYRQLFNANGQTIYAPENGQVEYGRWRVNHQTDQYESYWERSGWSPYGVAQDGDTFFWVQSNGTLQVVVVEEGDDLTK